MYYKRRERTMVRRPWYWNVELMPEDDFALLIKAGLDKHGKPVRPFETEDEADHRRQLDVDYLENGRLVGRHYLAPILANCQGPDRPCGSTSCRVCIRQFRRAEGGMTLPYLRKQMKKGYKPYLLTLVFSKTYLRRLQPNYDGVMGLRATLKTIMRRANVSDFMMVGGFEWDWDVETAVFTPHGHFIVMLKDASDLNPLRAFFASTDTVYRPMVLEEIREEDLPRALAYCLKFDPRRRIHCGENNESTMKVRPGPRERYRSLFWLNYYEPTNLVYRQRLKRNGRSLIEV